MAKSTQIIELLEKRIRHGDYLIREIPAERELASELGVNGLTVRKAYLKLVEKGLLIRKPNGRLEVNRSKNVPSRQMQVAFVIPTFSQHINRWRIAIQKAVGKFNGIVRPIYFLHWDDPVIVNDLASFDGVFLLPNFEPIPERLIEQFRAQNPPVVVLDYDLTEKGIPSLDMLPSVFVQNLLDHLSALGHNRIDCLNIQPHDEVIDNRISQWNIWRAAHNVNGILIDKPIEPPYDIPAAEKAYQEAKTLIKDLRETTAILCTTAITAIGVYRACYEEGIKIGKDLSICAIDGEGLCPYLTPSLTSLENSDPNPYLLVCLEWMERGGQNWIGPLRLNPSKPNLFIGESTGRCPS